MNDAAIYDLAKSAGIAVDWRDFSGRPRRVTIESLRQILAAMKSLDLAERGRSVVLNEPPSLVTATTGQRVHLPLEVGRQVAQIKFESGNTVDVEAETAADGITLPPVREIGYHQVEIGPQRILIAVAPEKCTAISDITTGQH